MDLQKFVDGFEPMTCIMSVEVFPDGSYGNIRIVCGNQAYVDSIENPSHMAYSEMLDNTFVPDSPYERYIPRDLNFEDACYYCAVMKKPFHTYVHPERYSFWVDMYMMPMAADNNNTYYCTYSQELTKGPLVERMSHLPAPILTAVLETCIKLRGAKDFERTMNEVIRDIQSQCKAEKVCIIIIDSENKEFSILTESNSRTGREHKAEKYLRDNFDDFYKIVETWPDTIAGSTCVMIKDEHDMKAIRERNPVWVDSFSMVGIKSIVLYPLVYNEKTIGYIWAVNFDTENAVMIRAILESTTYFLASEIANYQLLKRLEVMSTMDMLTGLKNRTAMYKKIDEFVKSPENRPDVFAVLYIDINGLKQINEKSGHDEGDKTLKATARLLRSVFYDSEIYRSGADEFFVIVPNIMKKDFEQRIKDLRAYNEENPERTIALGYYFTDTKTDIRNAMSIADMQMYQDKQLYYESRNENKTE